MGEVYRAHDAVLDREVALKVLHSNLAGDPGFIDRFRREARSAAMLGHSNIVAVHDWGATEGGTYFMVMEFVRGHSLRQVLARTGRLAPAQAADVTIQVLAALDHAHTRGIVHRDIKPENILLTLDGVVKVADFGLARAFAESSITHAPGTVTGTVQYLAPEQVSGDPADPRTDLYSLGVVLFELLTGRVPFTGETSVAIAYKHLSEPVPPPSRINPLVPPSMDRIVMHATQKDREQRPSTASNMRREVVAAMSGLPPARSLQELAREMPPSDIVPDDRAPTVTIPRTLTPRARRKRRMRTAFTRIALILVILMAGWATWTYAVPHHRTVPSLIGLTQAQAKAALEREGLKLDTGDPQFSPTVPAGRIMAQSLKAGTRVKKGGTVLVTLSLGPELRDVPTLAGKTLAQATTILQKAGFKRGKVLHQYSDTVAEGHVIDQRPSAGSKLEVGQPVQITLSQGPEPVPVPNVVGDSRDAAEAAIRAAGLVPNTVEDFSADVERGRVISTEPTAGTVKAHGDTVTIHVSKGPRQFPMPDMHGKQRDAAVAELEGLGLHVHVVQVPGSSGDTVVGQQPHAGQTVQQGDDVTIYIA